MKSNICLQVCQIYCPTHGASLCILCATTDHRQCPEVKSREKRAQEVGAELDGLMTKLQKSRDELEEATRELGQHDEDRQRGTQAALRQVKEVFERLEKAGKAGQRRLEGLLKDADTADARAVTGAKATLLERSGVLTSHYHLLQRYRGLASRDDVRQRVPDLSKRVEGLELDVTLPPDSEVISMVSLKIDPEMVSRLERELSELGQVELSAADIAVNKAQRVISATSAHAHII